MYEFSRKIHVIMKISLTTVISNRNCNLFDRTINDWIEIKFRHLSKRFTFIILLSLVKLQRILAMTFLFKTSKRHDIIKMITFRCSQNFFNIFKSLLLRNQFIYYYIKKFSDIFLKSNRPYKNGYVTEKKKITDKTLWLFLKTF